MRSPRRCCTSARGNSRHRPLLNTRATSWRGWSSSIAVARLRCIAKSRSCVVESGPRARSRDSPASSKPRSANALRRVNGQAECDTVDVALGERSYPIHVGPGAPARSGDAARAACCRGRACVIVSNPVVAAHWLAPLRASLAAAGIASESILVPDGERTRRGRRSHDVLTRLLEHRGRAVDDARGARRRRRRRHRRLRRRDLPARHAFRAGADDAARAGRFVGGRQDRRSTMRSART